MAECEIVAWLVVKLLLWYQCARTRKPLCQEAVSCPSTITCQLIFIAEKVTGQGDLTFPQLLGMRCLLTTFHQTVNERVEPLCNCCLLSVPSLPFLLSGYKGVQATGHINMAGLQKFSFTSRPPLCGLGKAF